MTKCNDGIYREIRNNAISDMMEPGSTLKTASILVAPVSYTHLAATSHLKGLKIGIMGCIVNGPGEMADADYGYVGAGRGHIHNIFNMFFRHFLQLLCTMFQRTFTQ